MRLLLDTHFLLWLAIDPGEIKARERALIDRATLVISPVSLWELRLKWQKLDRLGQRKGTLHPQIAREYIGRRGLELALLTGDDCAESLAVPLAHNDPFDEMLLIHAQRLGAKLLTRDRLLLGHPLVAQP
ncbi:type II toxin-antitoxin system VapC family toxin [uncultured Sphingomonas sp.]|uniref:type II toxin-antitoxin system VapC family toxin n=1 Tax=uncultured Sphingomonas sp. TaxID=158754 RepID=UPI0035CC4777